MTATVRDNALLLEVIAGPDGIDSRQRDVKVARYIEALDGGVAGLRIGVLKEGFGHPNSEPDVDAKVRAAAQRFADLGAIVDDVSVPMHALGFPIWAGHAQRQRSDHAPGDERRRAGARGALPHGPARSGRALARTRGRIRRHGEDRLHVQQVHLDRYGGHYYAKAQNLRRRLRAAYDAALQSHDLLLLPTGADEGAADPGKDATPEEITRRSWEPTATPARSTSPAIRRSAFPAA